MNTGLWRPKKESPLACNALQGLRVLKISEPVCSDEPWAESDVVGYSSGSWHLCLACMNKAGLEAKVSVRLTDECLEVLKISESVVVNRALGTI
jgi:hypothetical protein